MLLLMRYPVDHTHVARSLFSILGASVEAIELDSSTTDQPPEVNVNFRINTVGPFATSAIYA